jgi:ubiquinone/menaquinone biosynthesis C-methylase UbiE
MVQDRKRALLSDLSGTIVEIGPGAGPNLKFYRKDCRWIGVEPNPHLAQYLRSAAERAGLSIELRAGVAEHLPVADGGADAVVSTLVLCSVSDPTRVLGEILRVLKPGGRFVFIEHVAAGSGTRLRTAQHLLRPLWKRLADGCDLERETGDVIERAGFSDVRYSQYRLPLGPVGHQITGVARK